MSSMKEIVWFDGFDVFDDLEDGKDMNKNVYDEWMRKLKTERNSSLTIIQSSNIVWKVHKSLSLKDI